VYDVCGTQLTVDSWQLTGSTRLLCSSRHPLTVICHLEIVDRWYWRL